MKIDLPSTLVASTEYGQPKDPNTWRFEDHPTFVVLSFGPVEIARWEWQADRSLEERTTPDEYEIADFVAGKLRTLFPEG